MRIIFSIIEVFKWLIVIRAVVSWFISPGTRNPVLDLLGKVTDPILQPISRVIPVMGGLDLSPLVAYVALTLLQRLIF
ncbi:MAG: YggT family protein [Gemmatimonadota bacterium]|jgi:YggT family protein|nr:YggT family protein [Gemmatimonadota bacterium]